MSNFIIIFLKNHIKNQAMNDLANTINVTEIANLDAGRIIVNPWNDKRYVVDKKLAANEDRHTYVAVDQNGETKKIIKFVPTGSTAVSDLEEKLRSDFQRINSVLSTNYNAFQVNSVYLAVVGDFIEGRNLEQEINHNERVFTQPEVLDFLAHLITDQLKPLHDQDLIHLDIKPQNIIATSEGDKRTYSLIDFGSLRQSGSLATATVSIRGTLGYSRMKAEYQKTDDFYSLAKTTYFLLTGQHPEFVGSDKYDEMYDQEIFNALKIDDRLRKILFKMLGHDAKSQYQAVDALIEDINKVRKKLTDPEAGIDLTSARQLTVYRESSLVPASLQAKINGIKQRFKEQYAETLPSRNHLKAEFTADLEEVLTALGYEQRKIRKPIIEDKLVELGHKAYLRFRKESDWIDVLDFNDGENGEWYFYFSQVKTQAKALELCKPFVKDEKWYEPAVTVSALIPFFSMTLSGIYWGYGGSNPVASAILGGGLGAVVGFLSSLCIFVVNSKKTAPSDEQGYRGETRDELRWKPEDSYFIGAGIITYPHVVGKLCYDLANGIRKMAHEPEAVNTSALERALEPAPHFTYNLVKKE